MDFSGILSALLSDPSQSGGGMLAQALGLNAGNPGASTSTPTPSAIFTPHMGLLGNSLLGNAVRGGLSGLAGSTGYTGLSALGAGAQGATQAAQQRQQFQMQNILGGQQYQQGQLGVASGYGGLAMQALRLSRILGKNVSVSDLLQHPELMGQYLQDSQAGGQAGQGAPGGAPAPQAGMQPIYGGGTGGDPQVAQAYGPALNAAPPASGGAPQPAASPAPAGSSDQTIAGLDQAISDDYLWNDGKGVAALEAKKAEYLGAPQQAADVKRATNAVDFGSPQTTINNVKDLASAYDATPIVKTMAEVRPNFNAVQMAYQQAAGKTGALPSDFDLINGVIKMMNPNNANLRPNAAEALEEAKGYPSYIQKAVQAFFGGTGLTPEIRDTLLQVAKQHMSAYQGEYDTTVKNFQARSKLLGNGVSEDQWRSDMPGDAAYTEGQTASNAQGQKLVYRGGQWVPLQ